VHADARPSIDQVVQHHGLSSSSSLPLVAHVPPIAFVKGSDPE
jgi:hypothetical protein